MKQQITKAEFAVLDKLACAADRLHQAIESFFGLPDISSEFLRGGQLHLAAAIARLLAIDDWDQSKLRVVAEFVQHRMPHPIDSLLDELGVVVAEPRTPNPDHFYQGDVS